MGVLIPVVLLLSFMLGGVTENAGIVEFLPDRAGWSRNRPASSPVVRAGSNRWLGRCGTVGGLGCIA
jgi:hypothetical protein